jgi:hypothetical protein
VLSGIVADAVKSKRLSANPAKGVENLPRKTGNRPAYLSGMTCTGLPTNPANTER